MAVITAKSPNLIIDGDRLIICSPTNPSVKAFMEVIVKEVKNQPRHTRKRFYKILRNSYLIALPLLVTPKAHAQQLTQEKINFPLLDKAYSLEILPDEIVTILLQLIVTAGVLGVAFAILCLMIAGGIRMAGQTDKARNWSTDIIKGLGQILLAPVIILILVTITSLVFRNVHGLDVFF